MQSSIAVVMATFQGERFIADQFASLANQTRLPDRLVVSDDCSSDATLALIEAFAASAPFPVTIHRNQSRLGYTGNFISATRQTDAGIILFADQDDIWLPGKLHQVLVQHRLHDANASGWFIHRERLHPARRALRELTPSRAWAECDVFMECYYPHARPLRPDAVAAHLAQHPDMADASSLARFARAACFHNGFTRYFPGARQRQV
jgi:glycosyltransferase involved in cell wall biosynthesis